MAEEIKHILTTETFSEFDRCFRDTVFDRKNPFGYKTNDKNEVTDAITESEAKGTTVKSGIVKSRSSNVNSYVLATNADIEAMFTS